jgi:hypothetical protein
MSAVRFNLGGLRIEVDAAPLNPNGAAPQPRLRATYVFLPNLYFIHCYAT